MDGIGELVWTKSVSYGQTRQNVLQYHNADISARDNKTIIVCSNIIILPAVTTCTATRNDPLTSPFSLTIFTRCINGTG